MYSLSKRFGQVTPFTMDVDREIIGMNLTVFRVEGSNCLEHLKHLKSETAAKFLRICLRQNINLIFCSILKLVISS